MKAKEYDFSKGKRGPVAPARFGKTRITIRIDTDILEWFRTQVHQSGGGNYQTLINDTLRQCLFQQPNRWEELRKVIREELMNLQPQQGKVITAKGAAKKTSSRTDIPISK